MVDLLISNTESSREFGREFLKEDKCFMNQKLIAIDYLSKHVEENIEFDNISYESNVFDYIELDEELLPSEYQKVFEGNIVKVDIYMYDAVYIYFISLLDSPQIGSLLGVAKERQLLEYKFLKER